MSTEQEAAHFAMLDKNGDGKLTYEEWKGMSSAARDAAMYTGPRFEGEARVPVVAELEGLAKRIKTHKNCKALLLYLCFLGVYVGVNLCYPFSVQGEMASETTEWIEGQSFGDENGLGDVSTAEDFWDWVDEVLVASIFDGDNIILGFNGLVSGVTIAQRRKNFTTVCGPLEAALFASCPHWPQLDEYDVRGVDVDTDMIFPGMSVLNTGSRRGFLLEELPLYVSNGASQRRLATKQETLAKTAALREDGWVDLGSNEVVTVLVFYNANTKLFLTLQIRFLMSETGGIDYDILTNAGVLDPLSDQVEEAHGAPWKFRVTLEVIFAITVTLLFVKEAAELSLSVQREAGRAAAAGKGRLGGAAAGVWRYFAQFWNCVDVLVVVLGGILIGMQVRVYVAHNDLNNYMQTRINQNGGAMEGDVLTAHFVQVATTADLFELVNAICLLVAFFRLFKYLHFHPRLGIVSRTIANAWEHLLHFAVVLALVVLGYAVVGWIMFAERSPNFRTFSATIASVMEMLTAGTSFTEFQGVVRTPHLSWWAWIPMAMYYFGFLFVAAMLMINIFLGIMLSTYDGLQDDMKEQREAGEANGQPAPDDTLFADMRAAAFLLKKKLGIVKSKPRSSKVDPMCAYLTPADAETVRPDLSSIFNELSTVHAILSDPHCAAHADKIVPYRHVSKTPGELVVVFNYADVSQVFTDSVAMYLWALYGPGAPAEERDPAAVAREREEAEVRQQELDERAMLQTSNDELQAKLADVDAKLNIVLATLVRATPPAVTKPAVVYAPTPMATTTATAAPALSTHLFVAPVVVQHEAAKPSADPRLLAANAANAAKEEAEGKGTEEMAAPVFESKLAERGRGGGGAESKLAEGPSLSSTSSSSSSSDDDSSEDGADPVDAGLAAEKEKEKEMGKEKSPEEHFTLLIESLLKDNGLCPLQAVKNACAGHSPPISWDVAKALRRGLGIIQCKDIVVTDGGSRKQAIRIWKKAASKEDFEILERSLTQRPSMP